MIELKLNQSLNLLFYIYSDAAVDALYIWWKDIRDERET